MGKADLHVHTTEGDGLDSMDAVLSHAEGLGLDAIAITEHDDLTTALRARETAARRRLRIEVIPGVEVTTLQGHLVALFIERPVASFRRVEETVAAVRAQGGLCFVPHPMSWLTRSLGPGALDRLQRLAAEGLMPDALELGSANPATRRFLAKARRLNAERYHLPAVGASDAHFKEAIASAYTTFEGSTAADLRAALAAGRIGAVEGRFPPLREVGLLRALSLPIAGLRATPKKLGWRRTAWSFVSRYVS
jgi:predicted metal-dependent phosphoesterase TrpH